MRQVGALRPVGVVVASAVATGLVAMGSVGGLGGDLSHEPAQEPLLMAADGSSEAAAAPGSHVDAVEAFVAQAAWALTSPAVRQRPRLITTSFPRLNGADAMLLQGFDRSGGVALDVADGAARVLAHSGPAERPTQVMVEAAATLTVRGSTRRLVIGGTVLRDGESWTLTSVRPRGLSEPTGPRVAAERGTGESTTSVRARSGPPRHRILIAGDSLTQGSSGDYTWRYRLWSKLARTAPGRVRFVGTRATLYDNVAGRQGSSYYAAPFTGRRHSALWGTTYRAQAGAVRAQVLATSPTVLVVGLGLNDLMYTSSPEQAMADVRAYVSRARRAAPGLDVVLVPPPHRYDPYSGRYHLTDETAEFERLLRDLAETRSTRSQRIEVAAARKGWDPAWHTWDGTHPNPTGEALIAQRVSAALARLGIGTRAPDIFTARAWNVPAPAPDVTTEPWSATLSWSRTTTGATGMFIHYRPAGGDQAWRKLPDAVGDPDSWTIHGLESRTYEFRLVPNKGAMVGRPGPVTRATVPMTPAV